MSNLWVYWRRPSSVVRYRHGGESAIYPMLQQPIVGSQAAQAAVAAQAVPIDATAIPEDNVLDFPSAQRRAERSRPARSPRSGGKPKRRE